MQGRKNKAEKNVILQAANSLQDDSIHTLIIVLPDPQIPSSSFSCGVMGS